VRAQALLRLVDGELELLREQRKRDRGIHPSLRGDLPVGTGGGPRLAQANP